MEVTTPLFKVPGATKVLRLANYSLNTANELFITHVQNEYELFRL